ncbi:MAG TPA: TetR/AcrR family transcriptional regulator [Spirochaetota bacterium]|nr:TetR/AcrR family transcriptional regulator [Spirochaetota bacterium]HPJ39095.1 TetR/AcrR family transcriptional regulator [Spirochaetota bacterium]
MPKATRSTDEVEKVKEDIIECALEILSTEGYENLSMSKIGAMMDMTAANLYNYYKNKNELLIAIHKKTFSMLLSTIADYTGPESSPSARVKSLIRGFVEFGINNIHVYDLMFSRPIPQYTDYIGTPEEELALDEYRSSLKALDFAVGIITDYIDTTPKLTGNDPRYMTIKLITELHGVISLYNSRILHEMDQESGEFFTKIVDDIFTSIGVKPHTP